MNDTQQVHGGELTAATRAEIILVPSETDLPISVPKLIGAQRLVSVDWIDAWVKAEEMVDLTPFETCQDQRLGSETLSQEKGTAVASPSKISQAGSKELKGVRPFFRGGERDLGTRS